MSVRGPNGKTLREIRRSGGWSPADHSWEKDYIYRGAALLATDSPDGIFHHHLNHLGSLRLVTNEAGQSLGPGGTDSSMATFGYGDERPDPDSRPFRQKFTGHERDDNDSGTTGDLDYMMARYYSPHLARFVQTDPERGDSEVPQSLNRYGYALGNPLLYTDPTGRFVLGYFGGVWNKDPKGTEKLAKNLEVNCSATGGALLKKTTHNRRHRDGMDFILNSIRDRPNEVRVLVGHSLGAARVLDQARRLHAAGVRVDLIILMDAYTGPDPLGTPNDLTPPPGTFVLNYYSAKPRYRFTGSILQESPFVRNIPINASHGRVDDEAAERGEPLGYCQALDRLRGGPGSVVATDPEEDGDLGLLGHGGGHPSAQFVCGTTRTWNGEAWSLGQTCTWAVQAF